ncbi:potassium channel family protein [Halalkalibacter hemicellulosilyticus]|uniref:Potassium channel protein n=1 Tax=Halalkalibacter hemicellulosilyticusJCM 9152 TaxID=1236971 RepID=W4QEK0_9BACI|nr:potassium channel family protein [Halalkalibacter hemicellulosilyticus]GAE29784.1 potassium channel protein [Halalkalibacter hemicellulosilyticusJCM 9152]
MLIAFISKVLQKAITIEQWKLIIFGVVFLFLSSFIVYFLEPGEYKNPLNGFWFVMTTVSQVGFGDYIPKTIAGRLYTVVLYLVGVGFFAIMIAKWIDLLNKYEETKEIMGFKGTDHIVMINWSQKTSDTIQTIIGLKQNIDIVLIDQLSEAPIVHKNVHFIQGDATKFNTLDRANILQARSISIFAADNCLNKMTEDGKNVLIASAIKQFAEEKKVEVYTVIEILDEEHSKNAYYAAVNEVVISNKPFTQLMAKKALHQQVT